MADKKIPRTYAFGFVGPDAYVRTHEQDGYEYPMDGDLTTLLRHKKFKEVEERLDRMYLEEVFELS